MSLSNLLFILLFLKAEILGAKVFLVSHKTVYGHYDKNKIPLRKVALKWIKKKKFLISTKYILKWLRKSFTKFFILK